jgi:hypothetical protein
MPSLFGAVTLALDGRQVLSDHGISAAGLPEKGDLVSVILDKCAG